MNHSIQCWIEDKGYSLEVQVWFFYHTFNQTCFVNPVTKEKITLDDAARPDDKYSIWLRRDWLKALVEAGSKIIPPDKAMQNHLEDAITVRDRLLTMIEKSR